MIQGIMRETSNISVIMQLKSKDISEGIIIENITLIGPQGKHTYNFLNQKMKHF